MKYLLFGKIHFNKNKRVLSHQDKLIVLSVTQTRLLSALITAKKNQISRNDLLNNIWEKYGLVASDSNLNRNISLLRKIFQEFEVFDTIETIPKQGFIFHGSVEFVDATDDIPPVSSHLIKTNQRKPIIIISLVAFTIICIGGALGRHYFIEKSFIAYETVGHCVINSSNKIKPQNIDAFLSSVLGRKIRGLCQKQQKNIYFDDNKLPSKNKNYETHVAICGNEKAELKDECENYINYNIN